MFYVQSYFLCNKFTLLLAYVVWWIILCLKVCVKVCVKVAPGSVFLLFSIILLLYPLSGEILVFS